MRVRHASINDLPITEADRKYHWPLGRRPDEPSFSERVGPVRPKGLPAAVLGVLATFTAAFAADTSELSGMDPAVVPGNDFFRYANGEWMKTTEIPADRAYYGTGSIVAELTLQRLHSLLEEAAAHAAPGSEAHRIGDYYASFMDEAAIEQKEFAAAAAAPRANRRDLRSPLACERAGKYAASGR